MDMWKHRGMPHGRETHLPSHSFGASARLSSLPAAAKQDHEVTTAPTVTTVVAPNLEGSFCSLSLIRRYPKLPFVHIKPDNAVAAVDLYFADDDTFWRQQWPLFYLWPPASLLKQALILVPANCVNTFFDMINVAAGSHLQLEQHMILTFYNHPRYQPDFIGVCGSLLDYNALKNTIPHPPVSAYAKGDMVKKLQDTIEPVERQIQALRTAARRSAVKARKGKDREARMQGFGDDLQFLKRFLGLSPSHIPDPVDIPFSVDSPIWKDHLEAARAASKSLISDPSLPSPFPFYDSVFFVSIDIEAYEWDQSKVTEIGICTLDTLDLLGLGPGAAAFNWMSRARARHFRVTNHQHLTNTKMVQGCADRFNFGTSEFVDLRDVPAAVASCFRPSCSRSKEEPAKADFTRTIVLVGHDVGHDVQWLRRIGYDVTNLRYLHPSRMDTLNLDIYLRWRQDKAGAHQGRKLADILLQHDIAAWHLHNAGNDAALTLHALLAMAVEDARGNESEQEQLTGQVEALCL